MIDLTEKELQDAIKELGKGPHSLSDIEEHVMKARESKIHKPKRKKTNVKQT